ncbi:c-type cytochrome [bacterium]|nr:MAG: c-type cytochrome [bacterium]
MRTALLSVLLAAAPASAGGRALFDASGCGACHAVGGKGGNSGPDLSFVGFRRSASWLDGWLRDPHAVKAATLMPRPGLSDGDRRGLVEYLASLQGADAPSGARPWDAPGLAADPVARGKVLYAKAGCVACHGPAGAGGQPNAGAKGGLIPALTSVAETYTPDELAEKVRRGSRLEAASSMPAWGEKLDDSEVRAVAAYLLTLGAGKPRGEQW